MPDSLLDATEKIIPMIRANLDKIDSDCQLPSDLAKSMNDAGLLRLYVPKVLGGPELDPLSAFRVVETIGKVDGSAGWCSFNGTALTAGVYRFTVEAAYEVFGDPAKISASG